MPAPITQTLSPRASKGGLKGMRLQIRKAKGRQVSEFPSVARLLTQGGDSRIVCGPLGRNRYGCSAHPEPDVLAYGSSTASTISPAGFAAADRLRTRLSHAAVTEIPADTCERELERVRSELKCLCGLETLAGLEIIFGASGTDLHLFAGQLVADACELPPLIIRVEAAETGTGVPDALAGRHFSDCAALEEIVPSNKSLDRGRRIEIVEVKCRSADGACRASAEVDAEIEAAAACAAAAGRRVLLTLVDVSKTGLDSAESCMRSFTALSLSAIDRGSGRCLPVPARSLNSQSISGTSFSRGDDRIKVPARSDLLRSNFRPRGGGQSPANAHFAPRPQIVFGEGRMAAKVGCSGGIGSCSQLWPPASLGGCAHRIGAFRRLSEADIANFLEAFAKAVTERLAGCMEFELLPVPALDRTPVAATYSWDRFPTLFSFLLLRRSRSGKRVWLKQSETQKVHELLREDLRDDADAASRSVLSSRCQVGQPVACGTRDGVPVSALRLCVSSRLIVDAVSPDGRGIQAVIADAMAVLDKTAFLTSHSLM